MKSTILSAALIAAMAVPAAGQSGSVLDATAAMAIVEGCAAHATSRGQSHGIAVVDAGGHLVAAWRMDGNGWGIQAFAEQKARAAAAWGFATSGMTRAVETTPGFADAPAVVTVGGGVPIYDASGSVRLGGAGASGEAAADDEACVMAGIQAAGLRHDRAQ